MVARIGRGDEVITPPNSFVRSTAAIIHLGAKPIFADVLFEDQNIDFEKIARAITPKTKAIMPEIASPGGSVRMDEIMEGANRHGLPDRHRRRRAGDRVDVRRRRRAARSVTSAGCSASSLRT